MGIRSRADVVGIVNGWAQAVSQNFAECGASSRMAGSRAAGEPSASGNVRNMTEHAVAQHSIAAYAGSGMGSIGRAGGLSLIWLCTICACQSAVSPTRAERCERAADARQADTADLCLPVYELTRDPAAGARAARALQSRDGALPIVEWIANAIGDSAAGADAWLATAVGRVSNHDDP